MKLKCKIECAVFLRKSSMRYKFLLQQYCLLTNQLIRKFVGITKPVTRKKKKKPLQVCDTRKKNISMPIVVVEPEKPRFA